MATITNISATGGAPQVTVRGGQLARYTCLFSLLKPSGQTWPGTNSRIKIIHEVTLNTDRSTDTFSLGDPQSLRGLSLNWNIDIRVMGGGGPQQYSIQVDINQDGSPVMEPSWTAGGQVTGEDTIVAGTKLGVA
ncbi:MAG TPA: hypothetical protein VF723_14500 [Pyrinomonadaceae bacterium]